MYRMTLIRYDGARFEQKYESYKKAKDWQEQERRKTIIIDGVKRDYWSWIYIMKV